MARKKPCHILYEEKVGYLIGMQNAGRAELRKLPYYPHEFNYRSSR
jgi:hypothetical protein